MNNNKVKVVPIISYGNAEMYKTSILEENMNKSGIYKWNNLITKKNYVGSAINLGNRLKFYYITSNLKRVLNKESSMIYSAILKYGYSNFSLDILEYCEPDILISREQYYLDSLNPSYNILKVAGSRLGSKATMKTRITLSIIWRQRKIIKQLKVKSEIKSNNVPKIVIKPKLIPRTQSIKVKVLDTSNNLIKEFVSIKNAAKYFNISYETMFKIFKTGISYDNYIYKFERKDHRIWVYHFNKELVEILENQKTTIKLYNIPRTTLFNYIKSGKLYKNKYYFYNIDSKFNPYLK